MAIWFDAAYGSIRVLPIKLEGTTFFMTKGLP
jgi:hypothetical protein